VIEARAELFVRLQNNASQTIQKNSAESAEIDPPPIEYQPMTASTSFFCTESPLA
jgi:hypothetical protein